MPAYPVSNWSAKNARDPFGVPLNAEQVLQGVLNQTQDALRVEALPPSTAADGTAAAIAAVDSAPDKVVAFAYATGVYGPRILTITSSSAALSLSYVQTFAYVASTDDVSSITTST